MKDRFAEEIIAAIADILGLVPEDVASQLAAPPNPKMGDYAFPCFQLAQARRCSPKDLAEKIVAEFVPGDCIAEARVAGPYANFFVRPTALISDVLAEVQRQGDRFGHSDLGVGKTVCLDFSHPNIAKHLGVHHLRSTMIGNAIRNIHAALGYKTVAINHLGDWGTQFGQLITAYRLWGDNDPLEEDAVSKLNRLYVRFHAEAEKDASLFDQAREAFRRLEEGDEEACGLWERFREVSLREFERIYQLLGVTFDSYDGEAHYASDCRKSIERIEKLGLTSVSEGATIVDLEDYGMPPALLLKRDGSTLYITRDIAAIEDRHATHDFEKMLYVVDMGQSLQFKQLFKVMELMGCDWVDRCHHIAFGLMRFKGGKMSSRKGQVLMLEDVLRDGIERARKAIAGKNPDLKDAERVARQIGVGAVVLADLKSKRVKDVVFDWEEALSFEGETGPYLQYTHARLRSIRSKYGKPLSEGATIELLAEAEELELAKAMARMGATLERAAEECEPSVLCGYLFDLAAMANHYYHQHRVLGEDAELTTARVLLIDCVRQVLANGLHILGLGAPEEM